MPESRKPKLLAACAGLGVLLCLAQLLALSEEAGKSAKPIYAPSRTFEQRVKQSPRNLPLKVDSLVFPHTDARRILPGPTTRPANQPAIRYPDIDRVVWAAVPATQKHLEYLAVRKKAVSEGRLETTVAWCLRNKLPVCAEYELRLLLRKIWDFKKPEYQRHRGPWLKLAAKRQIDYTFPLPVRGEWYVGRDRTGHHRIKHFAAFAFDLVITKRGRTYAGRGRRLEDYYCWSQPIRAQADGIVMQADDKNPDVPIGKLGGFNRANSVGVYYGAGIQGFYGHIQQKSLKVKAGDKVKKGQVLALVGNSGASGSPHLHFTMSDMSSFSVKGRFCYQVRRAGRWVDVNGKDLQEGVSVRSWEPGAD